MPYRKLFRDALEPEQIRTAVQAYERALDFVLASGDADGDDNISEKIAAQIIEAAKEAPVFSFVELTNRAISRYRVQRAKLMVVAAKQARLKLDT